MEFEALLLCRERQSFQEFSTRKAWQSYDSWITPLQCRIFGRCWLKWPSHRCSARDPWAIWGCPRSRPSSKVKWRFIHVCHSLWLQSLSRCTNSEESVEWGLLLSDQTLERFLGFQTIV